MMVRVTIMAHISMYVNMETWILAPLLRSLGETTRWVSARFTSKTQGGECRFIISEWLFTITTKSGELRYTIGE
jgi:hypothetical protein